MEKLKQYKYDRDITSGTPPDIQQIRNGQRGAANKKIGDYLVDEKICTEKVIDLAVELQRTLSKQGVYKPLGKIMVDEDYIDADVLARYVFRQWVDILSSAPLFKDLSLDSVVKIAALADHYLIPNDIEIIREHDPGDTFCMIISGSVRVYRTTEDGHENILAILGRGDCFGEMALLTGAPRSASVATVEPTSLLVVPKNDFDSVLANNSDLSMTFAKILADRLKASNIHLSKATETEKAYRRFVTEQSTSIDYRLLGKSKIFRKLQESIATVAKNKNPVLITGELGTEKQTAAWEIHELSDQPESPFLIFDAETAHIASSQAEMKSQDAVQTEIGQKSALFGHKKGSFSFAKTRRLGLIEVGNGGTLVIENIEHLAESVQLNLLNFIKTGTFSPFGEQVFTHSSVRLIVTTTGNLTRQVESGRFNRELYQLFTPQIIMLPPLRSHKKDLNLIVDSLVQRYSEQTGKSITGINPSAYQQIMTYDWPGNLDELKVVIRRAVNVTQSDMLGAEHLFIGLTPVEGKITFNLLKLEKVQRLFKNRLFPLLPQVAAILFFAMLLFLGYYSSPHADSNISSVLTWGLWWPSLAILWLLIARAWCAICPMGAVSELLSRFFSLGLKVPHFIREYGFYISGLGFCIIIWLESTVSMPYSPRYTAMLITIIITLAALCGLLFQRRVWCRFICPLGHLSGIMARCSILELRANSNVCNNDCIDHSCYVGNEDGPGCPMFEGPFSLNSNQHCILCGNCVKVCPKQSPHLNLRLPGYELWNVLKPDRIMSVIVPLIIASQLFRGFETTAFYHAGEVFFGQRWIAMTISFLVSVIISLLLIRFAGWFAFRHLKDPSIKKADLFVYALLPLAFSFELAYQLKPFFMRAGQFFPVLGHQLGLYWDFLGVSAHSGFVKTLQIFIVIVGMCASRAILLSLACKHEEDHLPSHTLRRRWPIVLLSALYIWLFAAG
jgi:DNA-binding NtrC family response regulator/ferredoxin